VTYYRVYYRQECRGAATVFGCLDLTQESVEETHCGNVLTALLDSDFGLTWRTVTQWEKVND
jgi:hypothetical protein